MLVNVRSVILVDLSMRSFEKFVGVGKSKVNFTYQLVENWVELKIKNNLTKKNLVANKFINISRRSLVKCVLVQFHA